MLLAAAPCGFAPLRSAGASSSDAGWRWESIGDGGLAYAIDPQLCSSIRPRAAELFVTCDEVHAAVHAALFAWARTSSVVHFRDVSAQCESDGDACAAAEIYVTSASEGDLSLAECVHEDCADTAASVVHRTEVVARRNATFIRHATVHVNRDLCWQLDPSFCASLSAVQLDAVRVLLLLAFLALGLPPLLLWVVDWLPQWSRASRHRHGCCRQRRRAADDDDHDDHDDHDDDRARPSAARNAVRFVALCGGLGSSPLWCCCWLVVPPLLYAQMVRPCSACLDLRAALAHETGHVLGLSHPDTAALQGRNLRTRPPPPSPPPASSPSSPSLPPRSCEPAEAAEEQTEEVQPSIMLSRRTFSQAHGACPRRDDVAGLEYLYPSCRHDQHQRQQQRDSRHAAIEDGDVDDQPAGCTSPPARRGWGRLLLWAVLPAAGLGLLLRLLRAACRRVAAARRRPAAAQTATMLELGAARGDGAASRVASDEQAGAARAAKAVNGAEAAGVEVEVEVEVEVLRRQLDETRALLHAAEAEHERWLAALAADLGAATKANDAASAGASRAGSPGGAHGGCAAPSGAEAAKTPAGKTPQTSGTVPGVDGETHAPSAAVDMAEMTVSGKLCSSSVVR